MTEYYKGKLIQAYLLHEVCGFNYQQAAEHYGFGKAINDHIRAMFNRFVKIGATATDVQNYLDNNYHFSSKALEYYLRFVGARNRQTSARKLAQEIGIYDIETLKCKLRGMAVNYPDFVCYSDTLGLDVLDIK